MVVMDGVVVVVVMNMRRLLLQNFLLLLNMMLKVLNKVARHLDDMWFSGIPLQRISSGTTELLHTYNAVVCTFLLLVEFIEALYFRNLKKAIVVIG